MRIGIKNFLIFLVIIVFCSSILSYAASSQSEAEKQRLNNSASNEEIIGLYQELIALRLNAVEESKRDIAIGTRGISELLDDEIKAAEARIQLAQFQGRRELVIEELENLIQVITEIKQTIELETEIGVRSRAWIYEIDARLLETKIRLAKAKQKKSDITVASDYQSEPQLQLRLDIANKINNIQMKNDTLAGIAGIAARSGNVEIMKDILRQINDIQLKNQTARACAIQLVHARKITDALEIVHLINDLKLRNEIFMQIATMDYEWVN